MENSEKKNKIITLALTIVICVLAVGFAAFNTQLKIIGTANIGSVWNVQFTDIQQIAKSSGVRVLSTPTATGTTATFNVDLTNPGDYIDYRVTITNAGSIDARVSDFYFTETGSDAIRFSITGIALNDVLKAASSTQFVVRIYYDSLVDIQPTYTNNKLTVIINYIQDEGVTVVQRTTDPTTTMPPATRPKTTIPLTGPDGVQPGNGGTVTQPTTTGA